MPAETLDVELQFKKLPDEGADESDEVWLLDHSQAASRLPDRITAIRVAPAAPIPNLELSPTNFVTAFRNLHGLSEWDGLQCGEWLFPRWIRDCRCWPAILLVS